MILDFWKMAIYLISLIIDKNISLNPKLYSPYIFPDGFEDKKKESFSLVSLQTKWLTPEKVGNPGG